MSIIGASLTERIRVLNLPSINDIVQWKRLTYTSVLPANSTYPWYINEVHLWSVFGLASDYTYRALVHIREESRDHLYDSRTEDVLRNTKIDHDVREYIDSTYAEWRSCSIDDDIFAISWRLCIAHILWFSTRRASEFTASKTNKHVYINEDDDVLIIPIDMETIFKDSPFDSASWQRQLVQSLDALDTIVHQYFPYKSHVDTSTVMLNPDLSVIDSNNVIMSADADMYYYGCIVDFKVSKNSVLRSDYIYQSLMYSWLMRNKLMSPDRLPSGTILLNPLRSEAYIVDIRKIDIKDILSTQIAAILSASHGENAPKHDTEDTTR